MYEVLNKCLFPFSFLYPLKKQYFHNVYSNHSNSFYIYYMTCRKPFFSPNKTLSFSVVLENKSMFILLYYWIFLHLDFYVCPKFPLCLGPMDGELPPRARNQANNPPANNLRGGASQLRRHPRANNHPFPHRQREERFGAMGRNPHWGRRNQEGHTNDAA